MTKKIWLVVAGCVCSLAVNGMPAQAEQKKAESIVKEVMRSDVSDFNAGKKSADDVAASALKYAKEAQTEAARFLLLKGAFGYRVRAGNYDGAIDVISKIRQSIDDVPDATLVKILSNVVRNVPNKEGARLHDLYQRLRNRVRCTQKVMELEGKIKMNPSEKSLRIALGEQYAMLGEWDKALPEFAAGTTRLAKVAALERRASTKPCDVADAWWEASGADDSDLSLAYRAHAAKFYRMAIADGSLSGLKKAVVEKRLEEVKADDTSDILVSRPKPLVLDLGGGVKMEMVGCPKGKGILWPNTNCTFEITRPFWFGKYPVTVAEWERLMPPATPPPGVDRKNLDPKIPIQHFKTKQEGNIGLTRKEAEEFMAKLTQKFRSQIPAGYVFRLPTEKEWKYAAIRADSPDLQLLFNGKKADRGPGLRSKYVVQYGDCASYWKSREGASACCVEGAISPYIPVGSKTPNAWGIYDLFGPAIEPYLRDENLAQMVGIWGFCEGWFRGPFASNLHDEFDGGRPLKLRLVVGPDLMKERGIKPPNTGK